MDIFNILVALLSLFSYNLQVNGLTITNSEIRDLESMTSNFSSEAALWTIISTPTGLPYSFCNNVPILGGFKVTSSNSLNRDYTSLPSHNSVYISLNFWLIDRWKSSDALSLTVFDGTTFRMSGSIMRAVYNEATWTGQICGSQADYDLMPVQVFIQIPHTNSKLSLNFRITNSNTSNYTTGLVNQDLGFGGMRDVKVLLSQRVLTSVSFCGVTQPTGLLYGTLNCQCPNGQYWKTASSSCDNCDTSCKKCFGPLTGDCYECKDGYWFDGTSCSPCDSTCSKCFGAANQCEACPTGSTLNANSQCIPSAPPCTSSPGNDKFLYSNGSCLNACPFPLQVTVQSSTFKTCQYPCANDTMYFYVQENKCDTTCTSSYAVSIVNSYSICTYQTPAAAAIEVKGATDNAIKAGLVATSAVSKGSQIGVTVAVMAKMFQYIKYLNISYSNDLEVALQSWNSDFLSINYGPGLPETLENPALYKNVPYMFSKYDVQACFLVNYWDDLSFLELVLVIFVFFKTAEWTASKSDKLKRMSPFIEKVRLAVQTFLLVLIYNGLGDIVFYSVIEYRTIRAKADISKLSFSASICFILFDIIVLFLHVRLLQTYHKMKKQGNEVELAKLGEKNKTAQALFKDYKEETFGQQAFLLFFIARDILFSLILTLLFEHPLAQAILINIMNIGMILYLVIKRPLKDTVDEAQQLLNELALLIVNVSVLIMAVLDIKEGEFNEQKITLGMIVIMVNVAFNFVALIFMGIKMILAAKDIYKLLKEYYYKRKVLKMRGLNVSQNRRLSHKNLGQLNDTSMNIGLRDVKTENYGEVRIGRKVEDISILDISNSQLVNILPKIVPLSETHALNQSTIMDLSVITPSPGNIGEVNISQVEKVQEPSQSQDISISVPQKSYITNFLALNYKRNNFNNPTNILEEGLTMPIPWKRIPDFKTTISKDDRARYISPMLRKPPRVQNVTAESDLQSYELSQGNSSLRINVEKTPKSEQKKVADRTDY